MIPGLTDRAGLAKVLHENGLPLPYTHRGWSLFPVPIRIPPSLR